MSRRAVALSLMGVQGLCSAAAFALFRAPLLVVIGGSALIGAIGLVAIVTFLRAEIGPRPVAGATGGAQPAVAVSPRERPGAERVRGTAGS